MRVLLAGASGAIGRPLIPLLLAARHEVIGLTRTPGSLVGTGATEIVVDALDRAALLEAVDGLKVGAVIHQLTALAKAPSSHRDMRATNRLRAEGTSSLIAAARTMGAKKFVAASFFGGYGLDDHGRDPLTEDAPFGEEDGRADAVQSALQSLEQQVRAFGGVALRFGLIYDPADAAISPVSRTWDGVLPMLHVSDAASATVLALSKAKPGTVYNIADDRPTSYRAREKARAAAAGVRGPMQLPDGVLRRAAPFGSLLLTRTSIVLSSERATADLGWRPRYATLAEGLGAAIAPLVPPASAIDAASAEPLESAAASAIPTVWPDGVAPVVRHPERTAAESSTAKIRTPVRK
jgi:nucleoside-diphosphate-sugar epimerase